MKELKLYKIEFDKSSAIEPKNSPLNNKSKRIIKS